MPSHVSEQSVMHQAFIAAKDSIMRMVSRIVPPKEIEDIVQETYVRICQMEHHHDIQQPRAFLMKTAKNLAFDHLKRAETRLADDVHDEWQLTADDDCIQDNIFEQAASCEEFAHFCEAIRQLPLQCRKVFVLKKVYGYSQKEIAHQLNISENTVEKHISTGFKHCAHYMLQFESSTYSQTAKGQRVTTGGSAL
jgi:RNA polymerase sigma-70 factor (ECF subfamily)